MSDENSSILPAVSNSIYTPLPDLGLDYLELSIDSLLDDGLLQEIPIVKTVASVCKVGIGIHERNMILQLFAFIQELNSGSISPEKLRQHKEKLENNPQQFKKELGRITIILNSQIDTFQSKVLASIYSSFLNQEFDWNKFCELSEANRRIFVNDYKVMSRIYWSSQKTLGTHSSYQLDRLVSVGLMRNKNSTVAVISGGNALEPESDENDMLRYFELTSFGKLFCQSARSVLKPLSE